MIRGDAVILIGLMGAGKTSVGRELAARMQREFIDLDAAIVATAGRAIPEIFATDGEDAFRELESEVLEELAERGGSMVLATGGGTPLRPRNWETLKRLGTIVWLDVAPEVAAARAQGGGRPLLHDTDPLTKMRQLHAVRAPVYARADVRVDANAPVAEVVATIAAALAAREA